MHPYAPKPGVLAGTWPPPPPAQSLIGSASSVAP
jgi:hypothetical protein